uniref:Phospholipase/carboxylesterase/thioesterase domain-containing protein n=1 Tax=Triticum urartu TaxID=4572 RepID=A0A8R7QN99_TRIUA
MEEPPPAEPRSQRFVLWLHGLGDSGRANEPVAGYAFAGARWAFPTAPTAAVTCNRGMLMPSWFDIHDTPITSKSVRGEADVLEVRGERARHDRPGDIRGHKAGGRLRLRAQPGRRAEHRERAAVSQDAGRLRGLQRIPPVRRLLRVQGDGRGQEDAGAVGARASGLPGTDRGGQRRDQVPAGTAGHELRVQGVRRARPRAGALRAPVLRALGRRRGWWLQRRPRDKKRGRWRPEDQALLQLRIRLLLLVVTRRGSPSGTSFFFLPFGTDY